MMMTQRAIILLILFSTTLFGARIPIVVSPSASEVERMASADLAEHLSRIYRGDTFEVVTKASPGVKAILVGTPLSLPEIRPLLPPGHWGGSESFVVWNTQRKGIPVGVIAGADGRGVLYGVSALLEKLGWGFYLSYEAAPETHQEPFSFAGWDLSDSPLFRDRVVVDWHNFLSSASTWEFEDWQRWIRGAAYMRYNTVMVHAYGNNPMFTFRYDGQQKPIGYLATSAKGRDWGTEHVNDVRRLWGGEIFHAPVFGSSAAMVPDDERAAAAQALMRKVFGLARSYGLHVTFALDVDTQSANPQDIILTLPESARIHSDNWELANPDMPEGFAYWKAQVAQLLAIYPQIDRLVIWFRPVAHGTPWCNVKPKDFPPAWKARYEAALASHPQLRDDKDAPGMFAISRIAEAFTRALGDLGRTDVELGAGTWHYYHLPAADAFFGPNIKLYWLDYSTIFDQPATQQALRSIQRERQMLPVVWAQHDDRTFMGRPYTPFPNFSLLVDGTGTGFGIIHWTTRPLDIFFKSLSEQVWAGSRNRPLAETVREIAAKSFGKSAAETGGKYLLKWVTEGPMFGRDTGDRFIDVPLKDAAQVIARCRERLSLLGQISEAPLSPESRERLRYYRDHEQFVLEFFQNQAAFEQSQEFSKQGEFEKARAAIQASDPGRVIQQYARAASHGGMTRGEQALIIVLNLKWLPFFVSLRQALALEPARFIFKPTQLEPLVQGPGKNTFYLDASRTVWKVLGALETGAAEAVGGDGEGYCATGIKIQQLLTLKLGGIMGDPFAPGRYRVDLMFRRADEGAAGKGLTVEVRGTPGAPVIAKPVDLTNGMEKIVRAATLVETPGGEVEVTMRPSGGPVVACAAVISPDGKRP